MTSGIALLSALIVAGGTPADGFRWMVARLEEAVLTRPEIDLMTKRNPARFLGLD